MKNEIMPAIIIVMLIACFMMIIYLNNPSQQQQNVLDCEFHYDANKWHTGTTCTIKQEQVK